MRKRRRYGLLIAAAVCFIVLGIALMGGMGAMKMEANRFSAFAETSFQAAAMVNAQETHTEADKAVIASYGGRRMVIVPGNYSALRLLLTQLSAGVPFGSLEREEALHISFCGASDLYVVPDGERDGVYAEWIMEEERLFVRIKGNDIWERLLLFAVEGSGSVKNIEL